MVFTREPGGTIPAESCAALVLDIQSTGDEVINDKAEVLMFYAARVQLVENRYQASAGPRSMSLATVTILSTQAYGGARIECWRRYAMRCSVIFARFNTLS